MTWLPGPGKLRFLRNFRKVTAKNTTKLENYKVSVYSNVIKGMCN